MPKNNRCRLDILVGIQILLIGIMRKYKSLPEARFTFTCGLKACNLVILRQICILDEILESERCSVGTVLSHTQRNDI